MEEATSIAVCLLHVGGKTGDVRLIEEARRHYTAGLQLANKTTPSTNLRAAWNTACMLFAADVYESMCADTDAFNAIDGHIRGISGIVVANEEPGPAEPLTSFQLQHFRFRIIVRSLVCRRSAVDERIWQACSTVPFSSVVEPLIQAAMRLIMLLDRASTLDVRSPADRINVDQTMSLLLALETPFAQWMTDFHQQHMAATSDLLKLSYTSLYTICIMLLRETLFDLSVGRSSLMAGRNLYQEINQCADYLCQTIHTQVNNGEGYVMKALLLRAPFYFALHWFERTKNDARLQWCRQSEAWLRGRVSYMNWDRVLWFGFNAISWLDNDSTS